MDKNLVIPSHIDIFRDMGEARKLITKNFKLVYPWRTKHFSINNLDYGKKKSNPCRTKDQNADIYKYFDYNILYSHEYME